ncbi:MAG: hypothetical protein QM533_06195 [Cytophagales bacterium]|nr:hypothetical protein [Cytophagales bacterium]
MIAPETLHRGLSMTSEQILAQVDSMRSLILQTHSGGDAAYEQIRASDPLRRRISPEELKPYSAR